MVSNLTGRSYEDRMVEVGMTSLLDRGYDCHLSHHDRKGQGGPKDLLRYGRGGDTGPRTSAKHQGDQVQTGHKTILLQPESGQHLELSPKQPSLKGVGTVLGFKIGYDEWVSAGRLGA